MILDAISTAANQYLHRLMKGWSEKTDTHTDGSFVERLLEFE